MADPPVGGSRSFVETVHVWAWGCGGIVNSSVMKLLILLVVNKVANEGESCADVLSAGHVGR